MRRKTVRAAVVSDSHCPDQDEKAVGWAVRQIADFKPDYLIFGGDLFEADAASRFHNEKKYDLLAEYKAGSKLMDRLASLGVENLVWCLGNHDANLAAVGRIDKRIRDVVHWNRSEWRQSFLKWRQIPYDFSARGCLQLGQVIFWHGHDGAEDLNAIRINNATGGHGNRLVVGGHTHKPHGSTQVMKSKSVPLPLWCANSGTIGPRRPDWTTRQDTSLWRPAVVKVELQMWRACQPGRNWDCEVEVMA